MSAISGAARKSRWGEQPGEGDKETPVGPERISRVNGFSPHMLGIFSIDRCGSERHHLVLKTTASSPLLGESGEREPVGG